MKLKVKFLKWDAGLPVAMLHYKTARKLDIRPPGNISIKKISNNSKAMSAMIDTIADSSLNENEILISSDIKKEMNLHTGQFVDISIAPLPKGLSVVKKKLVGKRLSQKEIDTIIRDIVQNNISESEVAFFIAAMYKQEMSMKETIYLIKAMLKYGNKFPTKGKFVVDKHCVGGVAGNLTTPLVVSICASAGLIFPKTSSRAITSAAGTADVIESIAKVDFKRSELEKIIKKTGAFMVWGSSLNLVPSDEKIIKVEKFLNLDPKAQLLASIMAKKLAVNSRYILIDIPCGKNVKVNYKKGKDLKKQFEFIGRYFHRRTHCVLTDGSQPIGNGIGPILELQDVVKILDPNKEGPKDLENKALFLAGEIFEMTGRAKKGQGKNMAKEILESGKAFEKFKQIINAQGGDINKLKKSAKFKKDIFAGQTIRILEIDNKKINSLARTAGSPLDKYAGLYIYHHVDEIVRKGDKIITIYAGTKTRLQQAVKFYRDEKPFTFK